MYNIAPQIDQTEQFIQELGVSSMHIYKCKKMICKIFHVNSFKNKTTHMNLLFSISTYGFEKSGISDTISTFENQKRKAHTNFIY